MNMTSMTLAEKMPPEIWEIHKISEANNARLAREYLDVLEDPQPDGLNRPYYSNGTPDGFKVRFFEDGSINVGIDGQSFDLKPPNNGNYRFLDIGAGFGGLLQGLQRELLDANQHAQLFAVNAQPYHQYSGGEFLNSLSGYYCGEFEMLDPAEVLQKLDTTEAMSHVISTMCFGHAADPLRMLENAFAAMGPGGQLYIDMMYTHGIPAEFVMMSLQRKFVGMINIDYQAETLVGMVLNLMIECAPGYQLPVDAVGSIVDYDLRDMFENGPNAAYRLI